ncbi:hypothetical protein [Lichenicoccus roseus]|uniref:Uncharacterized protein n=1 Tax=Lichenicoccus roseus TaxID=2683649 RepID=A0A5R9J103_9PROT|nr:hypothetical protein [Lichenicoccus roseus]TLU70629.1 hypothetical protein FE263_20770 [Lichenicoccus roseus]
MIRLAEAQALLTRLAQAAPLAWRQDRLFRSAVIGMGVTLAVFLLRPGASHQDRTLPPLDVSPATPALLGPAGGSAALPAQGPSDPVPKIAPGHPLGDVTVAPTLDNDRFGTVTPGHR